jgi:hypothetical protein
MSNIKRWLVDVIQIKGSNIKVQVKKQILEEILDQTRFHIELKASKFWKKELIDVKVVDDKLVANLKKIDTITISNGLHSSLPTYQYQCLRYTLNEKKDKFIFQLGDKITKDKKVVQLQLF